MLKRFLKFKDIISPDDMLKHRQRRRLIVLISAFLILAAAAYMRTRSPRAF
jgi:hypothetical protein